jgi:hypothetical protein
VTDDADRNEVRAGLCATCVHVQIIASSRGSTFFMCRLSDTDPRFRKYPAIPVRACSGYEPPDRHERER